MARGLPGTHLLPPPRLYLPEDKKVSKCELLLCVWVFAIPWTVAHQAPLSMGFSGQEYWSGLPFPSPGDFPNPGFEPRSPTLQAESLPSEPLTLVCPAGVPQSFGGYRKHCLFVDMLMVDSGWSMEEKVGLGERWVLRSRARMKHLGLIPEEFKNYGRVWSRQLVWSDLLLERWLWQNCWRVKSWREEVLGVFSINPCE